MDEQWREAAIVRCDCHCSLALSDATPCSARNVGLPVPYCLIPWSQTLLLRCTVGLVQALSDTTASPRGRGAQRRPATITDGQSVDCCSQSCRPVVQCQASKFQQLAHSLHGRSKGAQLCMYCQLVNICVGALASHSCVGALASHSNA